MGGYQLGVDLGTTYTAAAVHRDGLSEIVTLGTRTAVMPTVVLATVHGGLLVGEAAERRALESPERTARQFKRRLGDTTPILLGGTPYSPQALLAAVLADVVGRITVERGGPPDRVAIAHPANWGPFKRELVRQIVELAGLDAADVVTITEPAAAALHYASQSQLEPGATVAVYDLGGGTFDAAVVRIEAAGAEVLGEPTGIEHLGGIDFDAAVFDHVRASLGARLAPVLEGDGDGAVVARLRDECARAKEALSSDADAVVGVPLPDGYAEVRITRSEFEELIRPALVPTGAALRRAVASAGIEPEQLAGVLLVGGSSRIPLVSEVVAAELGRPVLLDANPKHAVALGAAAHAAGAQVGEVVEVVGGEVDLEPAGPSSRWRPAMAAVAVLLALAGLVVGLVVAGDDPDDVAFTNTGDEEGDDDATTTTSSTSVPDSTTTSVSVLPDGQTTLITSPPFVVPGAGTVVVTTTPPPVIVDAGTTAPLVAPGIPGNFVVSDPVILTTDTGAADALPTSLQLTLTWSGPGDPGSGVTEYLVYLTPMQGNGELSSRSLVAVAQTTSTTVTVNRLDPADSWYRWEVSAAGPGGESSRRLGRAVVPNVVGQFGWEAFQLARTVGLRGQSPPDGSCAPSSMVCSQDTGAGVVVDAGSALRWHEAP